MEVGNQKGEQHVCSEGLPDDYIQWEGPDKEPFTRAVKSDLNENGNNTKTFNGSITVNHGCQQEKLLRNVAYWE